MVSVSKCRIHIGESAEKFSHVQKIAENPLTHLKICHPIHTRKLYQLTSTVVIIINSQLANLNFFTFTVIYILCPLPSKWHLRQ